MAVQGKESEAANQHYTHLEARLPEGASTQIVLVSVENVNALRRAYPNYFLDTKVFGDTVTKVLVGDFPDPLSLQSIDLGAGQSDVGLTQSSTLGGA